MTCPEKGTEALEHVCISESAANVSKDNALPLAALLLVTGTHSGITVLERTGHLHNPTSLPSAAHLYHRGIRSYHNHDDPLHRFDICDQRLDLRFPECRLLPPVDGSEVLRLPGITAGPRAHATCVGGCMEYLARAHSPSGLRADKAVLRYACDSAPIRKRRLQWNACARIVFAASCN